MISTVFLCIIIGIIGLYLLIFIISANESAREIGLRYFSFLFVFISLICFYFIDKPKTFNEERTFYQFVTNEKDNRGTIRSYMWVDGQPVGLYGVFPEKTIIEVKYRDNKSCTGILEYLDKYTYNSFVPSNPEYEFVLAKVKEE